MRNTVLLKCASIAALMLSPFAANATMISSIDMEVRSSGYTVSGGSNLASALAAFNSGELICDVSLDALDLVGSAQTCGGPRENLATLFSIDLSQEAKTYFEFGADWGRGGFAYLTDGGYGVLGPLTGDFWWNLDWGNSDVIDLAVRGAGSYTLNLLGFEGCCGGAMSLRYSNDRETWTTVTTTAVPEPGSLALLGLGLIGLGFARRSRATT